MLLLLLLAGCVSTRPDGDLIPVSPPVNIHATTIVPFSDSTALYKASLDIRKHHLSGIMVMRQMGESSYRIVFANQVGMTYFDLSFRADSFNIIYCFDPLNKKALLKILETDFRLLLPFCTGGRTLKSYVEYPSGNHVFKSECKNISLWTMQSARGDTLLYTGGKSNFADAARISFSGYNGASPTRILLENPLINLKLDLRLLRK
jgi:hypothetical protein